MFTLFLRVDIRHIGTRQAESSCNLCSGITGFHQVTRDLPLHELVVRHVVVESLNHPVAVLPRRLANFVMLVPVRLSKPCEIEPVLRPALPIFWGRQHSIHQTLVGVGTAVTLEAIYLLERGR